MAIPVGTPAPDFTLPSTAGPDPVRLWDHHGETVLLLFFPFAFTGT
jgi:peroxiredoxin